MMDHRRADLGAYECVEPTLGAALWRLDSPDTGAEERQQLELHVGICDACRLQRALAGRLARGLQSGSLRISARVSPLGAQRAALLRSAAAGVVALAAALALVLLAPPRRPDQETRVRGAASFTFLRPVEGEIVPGSDVRLAWRPIAGASGYRITLRQIDGPYAWQGETSQSSMRVAAEHAPPRGARIRALLEPLPADLAPPGAISVVFQRGTGREFLAYRARVAPLAARLLAITGLLVLLCTTAAWIVSQRTPALTRSGG